MRLVNKWQYAIVTAVSGVLLAWYQAAPAFADPDSYYHMAMAQQMLQHGLVMQFPWLPLTTLSSAFADQHLLYHLLLLPWVALCGPVVGVKVFQVFAGVALVVYLFHLLKRWQLPYAMPAMLLLLTCYPFVVRVNLVKASAVAILLLLIIWQLLLQKRYAWAGMITVLYTLTHGGFFLAVVVAIVVWMSESVVLWVTQKRFQLASAIGVVMVCLGCGLGMLASPYFPNNLPFLWAQFVQIGVFNYRRIISVGAEWYPFSSDELLGALSILLIGVLFAVVMLVVEHKRNQLTSTLLSLVGLSSIFFILTWRSKRFIEYLVPMLWLFVVYVILPRAKTWAAYGWKQFGRWWHLLVGYLGVAALFVVITVSVDVSALMYNSSAIQDWQPVGAFLNQTIPANTRMFHGMWDSLPQLMFASPSHSYIVGLDPTFLYLASPERYQQWNEISQGKRKLASAQAIRNEFDAHYVFIDTTVERTKLLHAYLLRDDTAKVLYDAGNFIVFAL